MLLVRSPLRISLGGGGTDLPSYYRRNGGYLIASSIDKYVYTSAIKPFTDEIILKYSDVERVKNPINIKHKIFKEILLLEDKKNLQIELTTLADVPAGTGLGSSGAFTVSVLKALELFYSKYSSNRSIAELACNIEIERLREPVGKQDQYASAIGGLTEYIFNKDDSVDFQRLKISEKNLNLLEDSLLMFFTGYSRSASSILSTQNKKSLDLDKEMMENLDSVKDIGKISKDLILNGDINQYGLLIQDHWNKKLKRSPEMCSALIKSYIQTGIDNGAIGGKLIGAGGGGFILFVASDKNQLREKMNEIGLQELRFKFDHLGLHTIFS